MELNENLKVHIMGHTDLSKNIGVKIVPNFLEDGDKLNGISLSFVLYPFYFLWPLYM